MPLDFNGRYALEEFDNIASQMIQDYPQTKQWYEEARVQLIEAIGREKDPIQRAKLKIKSLQECSKDLQENNQYSLQVIRIYARKLKRNLELLETIRKSPIGKVFFKDVLQKYEDVREKRFKKEKSTKFYIKNNKTSGIQELKQNELVDLSEIETEELMRLKTEIKRLERKFAYLKVTNKELRIRADRLANRQYFTSEVVDDFIKNSSIKKVFFHTAVKKYKKDENAELCR